MNQTLKILFGLMVVVMMNSSLADAASSAKVTAHIVNENDESLKGANVTVWFQVAKKGDWGIDDTKVTGKSDKDGMFSATGNTILPQVTIDARYDGFYPSSKWAKFTSKTLLNRWEPWNPTVEVVLKKKRNPVTMYIKGTHGMKIPAFDQPVGFDLEKGDWVAPYGKGVIEDFIFNMHVVDRAYTDYECSFSLTFSNTHDGIQEYFFDENDQSYYKWPFEAPVEGYVSKIMKEKSMSPDKGYRSNEKKNIHYIFRVRTKVDKDGNIVKALYGKLGGEFKFSPEGEIVFGYYLNPDGTRNLEEDKERNLFKNE
jgi:hypothetical protein